MKRVIIVGGGKVGFHLAKALLGPEYDIAIIEREAVRASEIAEELPVHTFIGDGTDINILNDASAENADYFVAATGNDADNLVACQIARQRFQISQTIARVIDPANERLFKALGIDAVISTTTVAAQTIRNVLPSNGLRFTAIFDRGDIELAEVVLTKDSPVIGNKVADLKLPEDCLLVAILRNDSVFLPRGWTMLEEGDRVYALTRMNLAKTLKVLLIGARS